MRIYFGFAMTAIYFTAHLKVIIASKNLEESLDAENLLLLLMLQMSLHFIRPTYLSTSTREELNLNMKIVIIYTQKLLSIIKEKPTTSYSSRYYHFQTDLSNFTYTIILVFFYLLLYTSQNCLTVSENKIMCIASAAILNSWQMKRTREVLSESTRGNNFCSFPRQ